MQEAKVGAVNFDSNLIPEHAQQAARAVEATPLAAGVTFGAVHPEVEAPADEPAVDDTPVVVRQFLNVAFDLTLNTGLDFLKGLKGLKNVDIVDEKTGVTEAYNFHNPFLRSDKNRGACEGLLRALSARIGAIVREVDGFEIRGFDEPGAFAKLLPAIAAGYRKRLADLFPVPENTDLFSIDIETSDGRTYPHVVRFCELFDIQAWHNTTVMPALGTLYHTITFNLSMNLGALYDTHERHVFVQRAYTFLQSMLKAEGLDDVVEYHVNYAFGLETLATEESLTTLQALLSSTKTPYTLVSRCAVDQGLHDWAPSDSSKLFGYGCDAILRSVPPTDDVESHD